MWILHQGLESGDPAVRQFQADISVEVVLAGCMCSTSMMLSSLAQSKSPANSVCRRFGIRMVFRSSMTLQNQLTRVKEKLPV